MALLSYLKSGLSQNVASLGKKLGLKDYGLSGKIAGTEDRGKMLQTQQQMLSKVSSPKATANLVKPTVTAVKSPAITTSKSQSKTNKSSGNKSSKQSTQSNPQTNNFLSGVLQPVSAETPQVNQSFNTPAVNPMDNRSVGTTLSGSAGIMPMQSKNNLGLDWLVGDNRSPFNYNMGLYGTGNNTNGQILGVGDTNFDPLNKSYGYPDETLADPYTGGGGDIGGEPADTSKYDRNQFLLEEQMKQWDEDMSLSDEERQRLKDELMANYNKQLAEAQATSAQSQENLLSNANRGEIATRNMLRARGILGSSAGSEAMAQNWGQYDTQRAQVLSDLTKKKQRLDDFVQEQRASLSRQAESVKREYQKAVKNIQRDLRFNAEDKAKAVRAANAAVAAKLAEINGEASTVNDEYLYNVEQNQAELDALPDIGIDTGYIG